MATTTLATNLQAHEDRITKYRRWCGLVRLNPKRYAIAWARYTFPAPTLYPQLVERVAASRWREVGPGRLVTPLAEARGKSWRVVDELPGWKYDAIEHEAWLAEIRRQVERAKRA